VVVTLSSYTEGTLTTYVDDGTGSTATNTQTAMSANGVYEFYFDATQDGVIGFEPSSDFIGCISNIEVYRLRNDFEFSIEDPAGDSYDISYLAEYEENKVYFASDVFALLGLDPGCGYSMYAYDLCLIEGDDLVADGDFANGDYTNWQRNNGASQYSMTAGTLQFIFEPLSGSNKISNGDFSGGATGWTLGANWALGGGGVVHTPGATAQLTQTITITTPPGSTRWWVQLTVTGRTTGSIVVTLSNVSYAAISTNEVWTFPLAPTVGGSVTFAVTPSSDFDGTLDDFGVYETILPWSANVFISNKPANPGFVAGNYQLNYDIVANTRPADIAMALTLSGQSENAVYTEAVGSYQNDIANYVPGGQVVQMGARFREGNNYYPGRITVDNVTAIRVQPFEAAWTSECMNYQLTFPGTKLLTAYCDRDSLGSTHLDALGFETTDYKLQMRLVCRSYNATMDVEANYSKYSNGNSQIGYAALEKKWQFVTDLLSESALMTLGAMVRCDHFLIGDSEGNSLEYDADLETFAPTWQQDGSYDLATAVLTLRLKTGGVKFNRHT